MGEAPSALSFSLVFVVEGHIQKSQASNTTPGACRPAQQQPYLRPNDPGKLQPSPVEKRHHQLAPSVGTSIPLQIKTDHSVTDGINPEHKQEQRQSIKDAGPVRRYRQPISRRVGSDAG